MIVYDQVEGGGLNGSDTYEDPDAGVKVTNVKTSGNGKKIQISQESILNFSKTYPKNNLSRRVSHLRVIMM